MPTDSPGLNERMDYSRLVLLIAPEGQAILIDAISVASDGRKAIFHLDPGDAVGGSFLSGLRGAGQRPVGAAYNLVGLLARVPPLEGVRQVIDKGQETWWLELHPLSTDQIVGSMEMAYAEISVNELARLRARRLLLDEPLPHFSSVPEDDLNRQMFELFVRGWQSPVRVTSSPFPALYADYRDRPTLFLKAAQLFAVQLLHASGTIERIARLDLRLVRPGALAVDFEGMRHKAYVNELPYVIHFNGECNLEPISAAPTSRNG